MKNTITQQQANERVEQYIRDAVAAVSPTARLEILGGSRDSPCDDPTDNGPKGRVNAGRTYWLRDIPKEKNAEYIDALVRWWTEHDFAILTDTRPKDTYVWVENRKDGFRMSVRATVDDVQSLSLTASSPCVAERHSGAGGAMRKWGRWVAVFAPLLVVGSCVWAGSEIIDNLNGDLDDLPDTSITQAEAVDRLDALAHDVLGLLPSEARPVNVYAPEKADIDDICIIGLAQKITGQVKVIVEYRVPGLTPEHIPEYLELFDRYAGSKGWSVPEEAPDRKHWFRVDPLFTIGMTARDDTVSVHGSSTCIWPDGHRREPWQR